MTEKPDYMADANELMNYVKDLIKCSRDSEECFIVLQHESNRLNRNKFSEKDYDYIKNDFYLYLSEISGQIEKIKSKYSKNEAKTAENL